MCMSVEDSFVSPVIIFPWKRRHPLLLKGAPPEAIHVKLREEASVLLILDGHTSDNGNVELIDLAREYIVHLLSIPPRSSHEA